VSVPVAVSLILGIATAGLVLALLLALIRHMKVLTAALKRLQDELQPMIQDIQRGSGEAQEHMDRLNQWRPGDGPGARIRR
jgi:hypothetical protein